MDKIMKEYGKTLMFMAVGGILADYFLNLLKFISAY